MLHFKQSKQNHFGFIQGGFLLYKKFYNIIDLLKKGDTLVLNDTKVIPARLFGTKVNTDAHIELLLLKYLVIFFKNVV